MNPWAIGGALRQRGGRVIVPREHAPLARSLPYRRAAGEHPAHTGVVDAIRHDGWSVVLGDRALGDLVLALGLVRALSEATTGDGLHYQGLRPRLMQRCQLPMSTSLSDRSHTVHNRRHAGHTFDATPESPPAWLDVLDAARVEVHACLPMRYYLSAEQTLGVRLPAGHAPLPGFFSEQRPRPFHVAFVAATSWPSRKDYGANSFALVARTLTERRAAPWEFTMITSVDAVTSPLDDITVLTGPDAVDCLDVFASAEVVIGNDTGLTHLAALTERPDGTGPHVIGLYGRHAHNKWTTGADRHHAVATPFSQMLALADRCPVRDQLDDTSWSQSASLAELPAAMIADFAGELAGWW